MEEVYYSERDRLTLQWGNEAERRFKPPRCPICGELYRETSYGLFCPKMCEERGD